MQATSRITNLLSQEQLAALGEIAANSAELEWMVGFTVMWLLKVNGKHPAKSVELEKLFKECLKLNDSRVLIAHAMWTDDTDGPSAHSVSRSSLQSQVHSFKNYELDRLAKKAQELMQRVMGFRGAK